MSERVSEIKDRLRIAMDNAGKISADLTRDLGIPSSAMSQYLKGKSKNMPIDRLYHIAKYLNVSEAWLMGYDIPMDRTHRKDEDSHVLLEHGTATPNHAYLLKYFETLVSLTEEEREKVESYMNFLLNERAKNEKEV